MRNNDVVRKFKKKLVAEFFRMRGALAGKKMDRNHRQPLIEEQHSLAA